MTDEWDFGQVGGMRIIERPRLTRILDESEARILMLVAPAGFGKTTLARQWLAKRRHGWCRGSTASADVAALAVCLANATHAFFPNAGGRMRERLRATGTPEQDVDVLAELLAEDLTEWPDDAWLAIDDYHFACESEASEAFIELLSTLAPIRLLIASRVRPLWATARRLLYGEIDEVGRTLLAMNENEASQVLRSRLRGETSGLRALAKGWPAAIGLASLTDAVEPPEGVIPEALYRFLAEELYQASDPALRTALCQLALVPSVSLELARVLFGDRTTTVVEEGARLGFLSSAGTGCFDVHPLVRAFLDVKLQEQPETFRSEITAALGRYFVSNGAWDEAFTLLERCFRADLFLALLGPALPSMLESGRFLTVRKWIDLGHAQAIQHPLLDLAEAEISFREGLLQRSEALGLQAAREFDDDRQSKFRAYYLAGISAHLRGAAGLGLKHHSDALQVARNAEELRNALWGQLLSSMILEEGDGQDILDSLDRIRDGTAEAEVRLAHAQLVIESQLGNVSRAFPGMELATHLVPKVRDPIIRAGFRTAYGQALIWLGLYRRALTAADESEACVRHDRLEFALPHTQRVQALAEIGLGRFSRALSLIEKIENSARQTRDPYFLGEVSILRTRLEIAQGLAARTCASPQQGRDEFPTPGEFGEYLGLRALAFAAIEQWSEADELFTAAGATTRLMEVQALARCGKAILALQSRSRSRNSTAKDAFEFIRGTGHIDAFVSSYRAYPQLLVAVYRHKRLQSRTAQVVVNAENWSLAKRLSLEPPLPARGSRELLSLREVEVLGLLAHGMTNREMAKTLFIAESTVKVHLRHIFEKLGVSSRMEAALWAASELEA